MGLNQINSSVCYDCSKLKSLNKDKKAKYEKSWDKVRPQTNSFPKRAEAGHESEDLPILTPGEKSLIALVHPAVTLTLNSMANKKFRQESISLLHNPEYTWSRVLPRSDLRNRFMVVERRFKNRPSRYIIANVQNVRQWLIFLFKHHSEYIRRRDSGELELSEEVFKTLDNSPELAEVLHDADVSDDDSDEIVPERGILQPEMVSGCKIHDSRYILIHFDAQHLTS